MKKLLVLTLTMTLLLTYSWTVFASPTDSGISVNLTTRSTDFGVNGDTNSEPMNEFALTYGSWLGTTCKIKYGRVASDQYKFYSLESNYYKGVGNGVSLILGMRNYGLEHKPTDNSKNKFAIQAGGEFKQYIADKTFGYGSILLGQNLTDYELGLGYKLTDNLTFDVNYRDLKIDKIGLNSGDKEVKTKGWGFGLSANF